ncbi:MAG: hypothetical protein ACOC1F_04620 [Myxococcota bacterium]
MLAGSGLSGCGSDEAAPVPSTGVHDTTPVAKSRCSPEHPDQCTAYGDPTEAGAVTSSDPSGPSITKYGPTVA